MSRIVENHGPLICQCPEDKSFYYSPDNKCLAEGELNEPCELSAQCQVILGQEGSTCSEETSTCQCLPGFNVPSNGNQCVLMEMDEEEVREENRNHAFVDNNIHVDNN